MGIKQSQPSIVYVGPVAFPNGGAAARRMLGIAQSLRDAGYMVQIGSGQTRSDAAHAIEDYQGFAVTSLNERTAEHCPTLIKHFRYLSMGRKTLAWLESMNPRPTAVILYSGYSPYFLHLLPWCEQQCIPLVFDAVEWYDPNNVAGGPLGLYRWNIELAMRYFCVRTRHIIAISSYLEQYYLSRGCMTVRIPPTLDVLGTEPNLEPCDSSFITIGYTGIPGQKDHLNTVLEGLLRIDPTGERLRFRLAGVTSTELLKYPAFTQRGYTQLPPCIESFGQIAHAKALSLIRQADYSVLLRPASRYAQAGFPTKVVESLSLGTPVICNITRDIGNFIRDNVEGVVCADHQVDSLVDALTRITTTSICHRRAMRVAARRQAERSFDYRCFSTLIAQFIQQIQHGKQSGVHEIGDP